MRSAGLDRPRYCTFRSCQSKQRSVVELFGEAWRKFWDSFHNVSNIVCSMVIVCDCLQRCLPVQNGLVWPSCCDMWILTSLDAECHHWLGTDRPSRRSRTFGAAWARSNHQVGGAQHLPGPWGLLGQKCSRMSRDVKSKAGFSGCYHRSSSVPGSALLAVEGCFSMVLQVSFSDFFSGISTWIVEPFVTVITPSSAALPWTFLFVIPDIVIRWPWVVGAHVVRYHYPLQDPHL